MTTEYLPITDPTQIFLAVLLIILAAPIVMGKLRIPHIVGMVLAGVAVGEHGAGLLSTDDSFVLFGKVGLYYILFLAALELDTGGMRKSMGRVGLFGLLSFALPFALCYWLGVSFLGYSPAAGLLLGCIMASNTLVSYPIVGRYGLQRKPFVGLSVGGSMLTVFFALLVLAAISASHGGDSGWGFWALFAAKLAAYCTAMAFAVPRLTRWFLRRYSDAVMQFIFVLAVMFASAALSAAAGVEGLFGAFTAGLLLNRYIPRLSPLMNRIEFIGNALFIPYFLISVGMMIDIGAMFSDAGLLAVAVAITLVGSAGKAAAAYLSARLARMPWTAGHLMFGLTSAHAAGAVAMVTIGMRLPAGDGFLVGGDMLNAVVVMILLSCVLSSVVTDAAAKGIALSGGGEEEKPGGKDDERILVPLRYPEYANRLVTLALLARNPKLGRPLVGLNVVYDDEEMRSRQESGRELLDQAVRHAAAAGVQMETQVRVAANIANGIKHAFKEFHASEIIIGMHQHRDVSPKFWGEFHQSLFNGLNCQIIMARCVQPPGTLRGIHAAVPSRAHFEPGFHRWLERLARIAGNLDCRTVFHGRADTLHHVAKYMAANHRSVRAAYEEMEHWNMMPTMAEAVPEDHLFVVVTARKGTVSYKNALDRLPEEITRHFSGKNLLIIFPDQFGDAMDEMTFAAPQHTEERSLYEVAGGWIARKAEMAGRMARKLKNKTR